MVISPSGAALFENYVVNSEKPKIGTGSAAHGQSETLKCRIRNTGGGAGGHDADRTHGNAGGNNYRYGDLQFELEGEGAEKEAGEGSVGDVISDGRGPITICRGGGYPCTDRLARRTFSRLRSMLRYPVRVAVRPCYQYACGSRLEGVFESFWGRGAPPFFWSSRASLCALPGFMGGRGEELARNLP
ncbi:hypothetical protein F5883DRAFT_127956 [Diaporthe sp. PMI_573]|nr:hypothetical protein F5883DRAFT_127956 [Diaporthaceae sp. PMI_573]